jgi:aminopeptidase C
VDEIFDLIDVNKSGKVDFSEFVAAAINQQQKLSRLRIEQSFKLFDLVKHHLLARMVMDSSRGTKSKRYSVELSWTKPCGPKYLLNATITRMGWYLNNVIRVDLTARVHLSPGFEGCGSIDSNILIFFF